MSRNGAIIRQAGSTSAVLRPHSRISGFSTINVLPAQFCESLTLVWIADSED